MFSKPYEEYSRKLKEQGAQNKKQKTHVSNFRESMCVKKVQEYQSVVFCFIDRNFSAWREESLFFSTGYVPSEILLRNEMYISETGKNLASVRICACKKTEAEIAAEKIRIQKMESRKQRKLSDDTFGGRVYSWLSLNNL